jgi:hypothetical protein
MFCGEFSGLFFSVYRFVLFEGCCCGCFSEREFMKIDIFPALPVTYTAAALCSLGM